MTLFPLVQTALRLAAILSALPLLAQILHAAPVADHVLQTLDRPQATVRLLPDVSRQDR
jgi:hypothetical protein